MRISVGPYNTKSDIYALIDAIWKIGKTPEKLHNSVILEPLSVDKKDKNVVIYSALRDVAQLGRALRSGRKGRRFESCHPDQVGSYILAL